MHTLYARSALDLLSASLRLRWDRHTFQLPSFGPAVGMLLSIPCSYPKLPDAPCHTLVSTAFPYSAVPHRTLPYISFRHPALAYAALPLPTLPYDLPVHIRAAVDSAKRGRVALPVPRGGSVCWTPGHHLGCRRGWAGQGPQNLRP